jgi:hypothetical protein
VGDCISKRCVLLRIARCGAWFQLANVTNVAKSTCSFSAPMQATDITPHLQP